MSTFLILFLSVVIGAALVLVFRPEDKRKIKLLTSFGGAYILSITALHLLPEAFGLEESLANAGEGSVNRVGFFLLAGFFLQLILDYFSQGIEHGHAHRHDEDHGAIPWAMMGGLCIHAYLEGMPLGEGGEHAGHSHGGGMHGALLTGIVMHNVPVSIVLTTLLLNGGMSRTKTTVLILVFAVMSPLGKYTSDTVSALGRYHREITAMVVGIFLHLSTTILFEAGEGHRVNLMKGVAIVLGAGLAVLGALLNGH